MWLWLSVVAAVAARGVAVDPPWWRSASVYHLYTRSFKDSDGDGIGDLRGVIDKADYLKELGVDAVWLSPIFESPMVDSGYDISDFTAVDPIFGTMGDFDMMMAKMKELDIKVLLDFVPNHSSDQHPWFQWSSDPSHPLHPHYRDFYVWVDPNGTVGGVPQPPNNWVSLFGGSAWEFSEKRQQFYLHHFFKQLPDFNLRNKNVVSNMTAVLGFWMARGVDGFRLGAAPHLIEHSALPSEPVVVGTSGDSWTTLQHIYMMNQPETLPLLRHWAEAVNQKGLEDTKPRVLFVEVYGNVSNSMRYYGTGELGLQIPFNYNLLVQGWPGVRAPQLRAAVQDWLAAVPRDGVTAWVTSNHDYGRVSARYGPELVDAMTMLAGTLPGVCVTYYGEELGMTNPFIPWGRARDPAGTARGPDHYSERTRDPLRTPMQWDDTSNAGFSDGTTSWLPVNPDYWKVNAERQRADSASHLNVFKAMSRARGQPALRRGSLATLTPDNHTLLIQRNLNESCVILLINLGDEVRSYSSQSLLGAGTMDMDLTVVVASGNAGYHSGESLKKGSWIVTLRPKAAVLLRSESLAISSAALSYLSCFFLTIVLACSIFL